MYFFIFVLFVFEFSIANSEDPDQTPHYAASDLSLHCLPMSHKRDARLKLVDFYLKEDFI